MLTHGLYQYKLTFIYLKIMIINPGHIFVQKAFLVSLFSVGLIIEGSFGLQNGLGLTIMANNDSFKY